MIFDGESHLLYSMQGKGGKPTKKKICSTPKVSSISVYVCILTLFFLLFLLRCVGF